MMPRRAHQAQGGAIVAAHHLIDPGDAGAGGRQRDLVRRGTDKRVGLQPAAARLGQTPRVVGNLRRVNRSDVLRRQGLIIPPLALRDQPCVFEPILDGDEPARLLGMAARVVALEQRIAEEVVHGNCASYGAGGAATRDSWKFPRWHLQWPKACVSILTRW